MKKYGIYLGYNPTIDIKSEGLGRYLTEILGAARDRPQTGFVVACPSWHRRQVREILEELDLAGKAEVLSPRNMPALLVLYRWWMRYRTRVPRPGRLRLWVRSRARALKKRFVGSAERNLTQARSLAFLALSSLPFLAFLLFWIPARALARGLSFGWAKTRSAGHRLLRRLASTRRAFLADMWEQPEYSPVATRLYHLMEDAELGALGKLVEARRDVVAWYSPTAFWPQFNDLRVPRLTCVPDVVMADFPAPFSTTDSRRPLEFFANLERSIRGGSQFVAYSEHTKWNTLVKRYQVDPRFVSVVRHGANRMDGLLDLAGFPDNHAAKDALCWNLFRGALEKSRDKTYVRFFRQGRPSFLFYASQFRPNKNVLTLLVAYRHLLRRRFIGRKLVLTGDYGNLPEISRFISRHRLGADVLMLPKLSAGELAACYRLADLAVNPSLSEGGFPFTFTEALSVGTPVVMGRIPVTEEVLTDPLLRDMALFDPYDWMDMAYKIDLSLQNPGRLLELEAPFYEALSQRTWGCVLDDLTGVLDRVASIRSAADGRDGGK